MSFQPTKIQQIFGIHKDLTEKMQIYLYLGISTDAITLRKKQTKHF